jgi:uncharacterized protein YyaL (SSP411 family)
LFVDGLVALHRATGERRWLQTADELTALQIKLFWDDRAGGFFFTSGDHERLIGRVKTVADSAMPSGNSVAAGNLLYLAAAAGKPEYRERAEKTIRSGAGILSQSPDAAPRLATALTGLRLEAAGLRKETPPEKSGK